MLNMIEWWICLSMPPDEVEKIALPRAEPGAEGADAVRPQGGRQVHRRRDPLEVDGSAVPRGAPSLYLALAQTEPEEKAERYQLMQQYGIGELDAAFKVAERSTAPAASSRRARCAGVRRA